MKKFFCTIGLIFVTIVALESCVYNKKIDTITIGFMGDVMIGRLVNDVIKHKGYSYPWGNSLSLLHSVDLRIINLETTLTSHTQKIPKVFNFKALPDRVKTLQTAHIDVANLANNHSLDFADAGLAETIATLDTADIKHIGAGMNAHTAQKPVIITKNNIKIGIIGYTDNEPTWKAGTNKAGINYIEIGNATDTTQVKQDIATLRPLVDTLIITLHWGPNMQQRPSSEFVQFAHDIIDSGADIIHGHSAHIFQAIEIYKNKIIMYDTGDFVDDYAIDPALRNDQSFFFAITCNKNGPTSVKLTPIIIKNMHVTIAQEDVKKIIMKRMQKLSQEFNTSISDDGTIKIIKK